MIWVESLTNPMLRHTDLEAVVRIARKRKVGWSCALSLFYEWINIESLPLVKNLIVWPTRPLPFSPDY